MRQLDQLESWGFALDRQQEVTDGGIHHFPDSDQKSGSRCQQPPQRHRLARHTAELTVEHGSEVLRLIGCEDVRCGLGTGDQVDQKGASQRRVDARVVEKHPDIEQVPNPFSLSLSPCRPVATRLRSFSIVQSRRAAMAFATPPTPRPVSPAHEAALGSRCVVAARGQPEALGASDFQRLSRSASLPHRRPPSEARPR